MSKKSLKYLLACLGMAVFSLTAAYSTSPLQAITLLSLVTVGTVVLIELLENSSIQEYERKTPWKNNSGYQSLSPLISKITLNPNLPSEERATMSLYSKIPHKENVTYSLVPGESGDQHWLVRFTEGPFAETVIQYGAIKLVPEDEGKISFNFFVESSPDPNLTSEDVDLQLWSGDVLEEILRQSLEEGSAQIFEEPAQ